MVHFPSPSISSGVSIPASHQCHVETHQQGGHIYGPAVVGLLLMNPSSIQKVVGSMCTMLLLDAVGHALVFFSCEMGREHMSRIFLGSLDRTGG